MHVKFRSEFGVNMEKENKDEYVPLTVEDARSLTAIAIYNSDPGVKRAIQIVDDMIREQANYHSDYLYNIDFDKTEFDEVRKLAKKKNWISNVCYYYQYRGFTVEDKEYDKNYDYKSFTLKWDV